MRDKPYFCLLMGMYAIRCDWEAMNQKQKKYPLAKHHAWGGLALLSLISALRLLFPDLPDWIAFPLIGLLIIYILVWLGLTYRYRKELPREKSSPDISGKDEGKIRKKEVKNRLKLEKKRAGSEIKKRE